jgi:hypothetical protein
MFRHRLKLSRFQGSSCLMVGKSITRFSLLSQIRCYFHGHISSTHAVSLDCVGGRHFGDPKQAVSGNGSVSVTYNANSPPTKTRPWVAIRDSSLKLRNLSVNNAYYLSAHIHNEITPLTTSRALCIPCATLLRRQLNVGWRGSGRHWCCYDSEWPSNSSNT